MKMNSDPLVSIIVPTKNSDEFLDRVLINLIEQTYRYKELIVVDNYSKDWTPKIAKNWAHKFYQKGPERSTQMNYGIKKASGKIIYVTGSDMLRDIDFVDKGVKLLNRGYDAIYMSVLTDWRVKHFWGEVKALERRCYIGSQYESARFFLKDVWEELGGFDEKLVGVEEDFQHRLDKQGFKTGRTSAREYHLHEIDNIREVYRKYFYYGKFVPHYLGKHKGFGVKFLNIFRPCFFTHWYEFVLHPGLAVGFVIYKCFQYAGGIMGLWVGQEKKDI